MQISKVNSLPREKREIPVWHPFPSSLLTATKWWKGTAHLVQRLRGGGKASTPLFSHGSFPKGLPCSWQHPKDPGAADQSACLWSLHLDLRATLLPRQPVLPTGNEKKKDKLYKIFLQLNFSSSRVGAMWRACLLVSLVSFWQQNRILGYSIARGESVRRVLQHQQFALQMTRGSRKMGNESPT